MGLSGTQAHETLTAAFENVLHICRCLRENPYREFKFPNRHAERRSAQESRLVWNSRSYKPGIRYCVNRPAP